MWVLKSVCVCLGVCVCVLVYREGMVEKRRKCVGRGILPKIKLTEQWGLSCD